MKRFTLFKSLLVAAGLLVGSSAWANTGDVVTNAKVAFDGSATFANSSAITYTNAEAEVGSSTGYIWKDKGNGVGGALVGDDDKHLRLSNGYFEITMIGADAGTKDIVTIAFDLAFGYQYVSNGTAEQRFIISDKDGKEVITESFNVNSRTLASSTMGLTTDDVFLPSASADTNWDNKVHFVVTFNYATNKMSLSTSCSVANNKTQELVKDIPSDVSTIKKLKVQSYSIATGRGLLLDNILITTTEGNYAAVSTTYKVKYVSGGVEVKDAETRTGDVGDGIALEAADKAEFYNADGSKKYVYNSDDAEGKTIAAEDATVVTVTFDEYEKRTYTFKAVDKANTATVLATVAEGFVYADAATATINTPWYILCDGTLYTKSGNTASADIASNGQVVNLEYDATETTGVVYYSEGELIDGRSGTLSNSVASNYGTARFATETTFKTVSRGKYKIVTMIHCGNTSGGTAVFKAGGAEVGSKAINTGNNQGYTTDEFLIFEDTDLSVTFGGGNSTGIDYIYVVKTGNIPTSVPATIGTAGWATLYTDVPLDFSAATPALEAYTATVSGSTVTLTKVDDVPAGTGVVLKGSADTYSVPVIAASSTEKGDLKGSTTTATACTEEGGIYMLSKNGAGDAQFKKATSGSIAAGKAYLQISGGGDASLRVVIEGEEATGIHALNAADTEEGVTYNVAGQRVSGSYKGIVIKNGKKYLNK